MSNEKEKIAKAAEILKKFRIDAVASKILNESYRYSSTPDISFNRSIDKDYVEESINGIVLNFQDHEIVVATTRFKSSSVPDAYDRTLYADGLIYFDGVLVLRVGVSKNHDEYGSKIDFRIYDFSIKSMKAGDWLGLMSKCLDLLEDDVKRRGELKKAKHVQKQASEIDLVDC